MRWIRKCGLVALVAILACATTFYAARVNARDKLERYEFSEQKMGVPASLILYAETREQAEAAARAAWERFDALNATLSDWDPESESVRACRESETTGDFAPISDELRRALEESRKFCELTDGAFDATVGPIVKLWRRSRFFHEAPPEDMLEAARKKVGLDVWTLSERGVRVEKNVRFDFGGIAKGIAMDEALEAARAKGVRSILINASGDLRAGDAPPGKSGWVVGVASLTGEPAFYFEISNVGVAASGDANRYVEIDGVRYSHIVDPRSGRPLTRRCVATTMAPDATTADALASALCVLGAREAPSVLEKFRRDDDGTIRALEYALATVKDGAEPPYDADDVEICATPFFQKLIDAREAEGSSEN